MRVALKPVRSSEFHTELPAAIEMSESYWPFFQERINRGDVCRLLVCDPEPKMVLAVWPPSCSDPNVPEQFTEAVIGDSAFPLRVAILTMFLPP